MPANAAHKAKFELVDRDGVVAVVIRGGRLLVLKRRNLPLIMIAPGIWTFITGGRKPGEMGLHAAYREVREESGICRDALHRLAGPVSVMLFDPVRMDKMWRNSLFVFGSDTDEVKLNVENSRYRWAAFRDITEDREYTNIFLDRSGVERLIAKLL